MLHETRSIMMMMVEVMLLAVAISTNSRQGKAFQLRSLKDPTLR